MCSHWNVVTMIYTQAWKYLSWHLEGYLRTIFAVLKWKFLQSVMILWRLGATVPILKYTKAYQDNIWNCLTVNSVLVFPPAIQFPCDVVGRNSVAGRTGWSRRSFCFWYTSFRDARAVKQGLIVVNIIDHWSWGKIQHGRAGPGGSNQVCSWFHPDGHMLGAFISPSDCPRINPWGPGSDCCPFSLRFVLVDGNIADTLMMHRIWADGGGERGRLAGLALRHFQRLVVSRLQKWRFF